MSIDYVCPQRRFLQGDIINWERDEWQLRSPWGTSVSEMLDLERDVCNMREEGLLMVPQKFSFQESLHVCRKLSGQVLSYTDNKGFQEIIHFLSLSQNMKASGCSEAEGSSRTLHIWGGGSDKEEETVWRTYDTNIDIKVQKFF